MASLSCELAQPLAPHTVALTGSLASARAGRASATNSVTTARRLVMPRVRRSRPIGSRSGPRHEDRPPCLDRSGCLGRADIPRRERPRVSAAHVQVRWKPGQPGGEDTSNAEVLKVVELILEHAEQRPEQSLGVIGQEQGQAGGGALDLLAVDGETDISYSIEVQLGEIDASHSFRVFDHWARNRIRYPGKTHAELSPPGRLTDWPTACGRSAERTATDDRKYRHRLARDRSPGPKGWLQAPRYRRALRAVVCRAAGHAGGAARWRLNSGSGDRGASRQCCDWWSSGGFVRPRAPCCGWVVSGNRSWALLRGPSAGVGSS